MRIILHAGLHKSGTTTIQSAWKQAYAVPDRVWYPAVGDGAPGHQLLMRPLLAGFRDGSTPDLADAAAAYARRGGYRTTLTTVLDEARRLGVETLVLSAEDLARATRQDDADLADVIGHHDVTLLLTVTRPAHRWASGWQTLVRQGLAQYPRDAADLLLRFARLGGGPRGGGVRDLLADLPAARRVVRLVRISPPEPDLAGSVTAALGLPGPVTDDHPRNRGTGRDIEIVRRLNHADRAVGLDADGRAHLARLRSAGLTFRDDPALAARYALPDDFAQRAADEQSWLTSLVGSDGVELLDPHGQLATWTDPSLPGWYAEISRSEAVLPELDDLEDFATQAWRLRQQRAEMAHHLARRAERVERRRNA